MFSITLWKSGSLLQHTQLPWKLMSSFHTIQGCGRGLLLKGCVQVSWRYTPTRSSLFFARSPKQQFVPKYERDKVARTHELIYVNNMNNYYFWCQLFLYTLTIPSCFIGVYLLIKYRHNLKEEFSLHGLEHTYAVAIPYLLFSVFLTCFMNSACRRALIRIYHHADTDTFVAIGQRWTMLRHQLHFSMEDCKPLPKMSASTLRALGGNIRIKRRTFLIRDTDFKKPMYYNKLMGWERGEEDRLDKIDDRFR